METPEHERRWIEEYLRSQSGEDFEIDHVEKLTSEYVMGREYDVWDAHTNEGRWWVITNPTNLYSQEAIKSMDVALSFHVGLMARVLSDPSGRDRGGAENWILDVLRRLDVANANLDRAKEVEDFQAVGMRLREALVSLGESLKTIGVADGATTMEHPKRSDFKAWAAIGASAMAPGSEGEALRALLKATSEKTWAYVNRLTHARRATEIEARLAVAATTQVVNAFIMASERWRLGPPERCPTCGSNRLALENSDQTWVRICRICGWRAPAEAPSPTAARHEHEAPAAAPEGECVEVEDFGIYLSPHQAQGMLEDVFGRMPDEADCWSRPFAVPTPDGAVIDAHRLVFEAARGQVSPGVELVYECADDGCVNPAHAVEEHLPDASGWVFAVVERARAHPEHVELRVSTVDGAAHDLFVEWGFLDRFGFGDVSALPERLLLVSPPDRRGWVHVAPVELRMDYGLISIAEGWVHPAQGPAVDEPCPCGSDSSYGACHGAGFDGAIQRASPPPG